MDIRSFSHAFSKLFLFLVFYYLPESKNKSEYGDMPILRRNPCQDGSQGPNAQARSKQKIPFEDNSKIAYQNARDTIH